MPSILDIIKIAKVSQWLSSGETDKSVLFPNAASNDPNLPLLIYRVRKSVEWKYNLIGGGVTGVDGVGTILITSTGNDGDKIRVRVLDPLLGLLLLGEYTKVTGDTTTTILATNIVTLLNTNPYAYRCSNINNLISVKARPGVGALINGGANLQVTIIPAALSTPVLSLLVISDSEIDVSWGSVTNATNYVLYHSTVNVFGTATQIYSGSGLSFNDTGLSSTTQYFYWIVAQASGYADSAQGVANAYTSPIPLANLWGHWIASKGVTTSGGNSVTQWNDISGQGHDFIAVSNPFYTNNAINSQPAISKPTGLAALMQTAANMPDSLAGMTIYIVASQKTDTNGVFIASGSINIGIVRGGTTSIITKMRSSSGLVSVPTITNDVFYTVRSKFSSGTASMAINNGTENFNTPGVVADVPTILNVFALANGTQQGDKSIAEIIVYNEANSPTIVTAIETYLKNKYNHY